MKSRSPSSASTRRSGSVSDADDPCARLPRAALELLADLRHGAVEVRPVVADRRGTALDLARAQQGRERLGDVVEHALAPLLLGLDRLPPLADVAGRRAPRPRRTRADACGRASRGLHGRPRRRRLRPAPRGGARGRTPGRAGRRARRGASPDRRRAPPLRPRRPPRPCAGRSSWRSAPDPTGT